MESSVITANRTPPVPCPSRRRYAPTCINHLPPIIGRLTLGRPGPIYCRAADGPLFCRRRRLPASVARRRDVEDKPQSRQQIDSGGSEEEERDQGG